MPSPVGGAFSLHRSSPYSSTSQRDMAYYDALRYYVANLKCEMVFFSDIIPRSLGKIDGVMVLETKKRVRHNGLYILMKGLPISGKKWRQREVESGRSPNKIPVTYLKFTVLRQDEEVLIEADSKETYPLEFKLPSCVADLPPPLITSEGKLAYSIQAFMTSRDKHEVKVGETAIQFQGSYNLMENLEDAEKSIKIVQQVNSKRSYMGLGRKKTVNAECTVNKSGYLPQEYINFTVVGKSLEKIPVQFECRVELVQKVWYQVLPKIVGERMPVMMKINVISVVSANESIEPGEDMVWEEKLFIPEGQVSTYKFDFMNSVNYALRVTFALNGDKEAKVVGEAPIYIGTSWIIDEESEMVKADAENGVCNKQANEEEGTSPSGFGTEAQIVMRTSQSMTFAPGRLRSGSMSSLESQVSSESLFRLPPSYSQLSSRRSTLETLPPHYSDLEWTEKHYEEDETANSDEEKLEVKDDDGNEAETHDE